MKRLTTILTLAISMMSGVVLAQGETINSVKSAIKTGSSKELGKFFYQSVDVTIDGNIETYSNTQAEYVLRDFFKDHVPDSFTIIHQGASKGGLHFAIGEYASKSDTFRIFIRIKSSAGKYLVHEVTIDKE